ncbi:hypothetical protein CTAYLR_007677 [Chrysophaeum taylorii]|uniref:GST C-terminal domain-containing protein n=1 Tax=Chrysophaeum taylorii TaxID=2483200 RepID=A0AAD7U759_9STRA|nr:hypothetical protein CTAYLR_007677 [Chrysophaeum taylorii]
MSSYTLYYWTACEKFWGRGIPIVLTLDSAGAKYEIKQADEAPSGVCFAVPIFSFPNGVTISQTTAILDILGETFGLNGATPEAKMMSKQYLLDLTDVFSELMSGKLSDEARADKWLTLLNSKLTKTFFLGDAPSTVDFYAIFVFEWIVKKGLAFDKYANLTKWWAAIKEVPAVKKMYSSGVPMIP